MVRAGYRTRTGTVSPPADFESAMSAISSIQQKNQALYEVFYLVPDMRDKPNDVYMLKGGWCHFIMLSEHHAQPNKAGGVSSLVDSMQLFIGVYLLIRIAFRLGTPRRVRSLNAESVVRGFIQLN